MRNLDFNLESSYRDANNTTTYGDYNGNGEIQSIKEELTTGKGWKPIAKGYMGSRRFTDSTFDGQGFEIRNIYLSGYY